jgi:hypothetical protein
VIASRSSSVGAPPRRRRVRPWRSSVGRLSTANGRGSRFSSRMGVTITGDPDCSTGRLDHVASDRSDFWRSEGTP